MCCCVQCRQVEFKNEMNRANTVKKIYSAFKRFIEFVIHEKKLRPFNLQQTKKYYQFLICQVSNISYQLPYK
jgi:hypothetical protein